jgi:hypothetical protein
LQNRFDAKNSADTQTMVVVEKINRLNVETSGLSVFSSFLLKRQLAFCDTGSIWLGQPAEEPNEKSRK